MSKLSKEEQKKQNKIVIISILILLPIAIIIGLSLRKKDDKQDEKEEITLLKQSIAQYTTNKYTYPKKESDYIIDYDAFTKWIDNGNSYLNITCTLKDNEGKDCIVSAIYTSNDRNLHYLSIRNDVLYDDHTTDKEE